jgi:hypothetical protein
MNTLRESVLVPTDTEVLSQNPGSMMTMTLEHPGVAARRDDAVCQTSAGDYLRALIGDAPDDLLWDEHHHLQGHAHCGGHEIIVIAARDDQHSPIVLTPEDWNGIRRAEPAARCTMLRACAIDSHDRLLEVLAS